VALRGRLHDFAARYCQVLVEAGGPVDPLWVVAFVAMIKKVVLRLLPERGVGERVVSVPRREVFTHAHEVPDEDPIASMRARKHLDLEGEHATFGDDAHRIAVLVALEDPVLDKARAEDAGIGPAHDRDVVRGEGSDRRDEWFPC